MKQSLDAEQNTFAENRHMKLMWATTAQKTKKTTHQCVRQRVNPRNGAREREPVALNAAVKT